MINIARLTLIIAITSGACLSPACKPIDFASADANQISPQQTPVRLPSKESKRVLLDGLSLAIPDSLAIIPVKTIDSKVWKFSDAEMTVELESGIYPPKLENHQDLNFRRFQKMIDGELCQIITFEDGNPSNLVDPDKKYCVMGRFDDSERVAFPLFISVCFKSILDRQIAIDIVESIKFEGKNGSGTAIP